MIYGKKFSQLRIQRYDLIRAYILPKEKSIVV